MPLEPGAPLSRIVSVDALPSEDHTIVVEASADERAAVAKLDNLVEIGSLVGRFRLRPERQGGVHVVGSVYASVTQTCVLTLDPFDSQIEEPVDVLFLPPKAFETWLAAHKKRTEEVDTDEEEDDPPEQLLDGRIDLGALTAEFLTLSLDPYPRKPGAAFVEPAPAEKEPSPFAALAELKQKL